jgi:hypothetical protein
MNFYLIVFIIAIIFYCYCYFIFPSSISILQTTIKDFNFSLLHLRQPIVISDYLHDKDKLVYSWFNYNTIKQLYNEDNDDENNNWKHNNNKYLFINANNDTEIIIHKASFNFTIPDENDKIIAIKLEKDQSLIIPYKWKYYINNKNDVIIWTIDDYITSFLRLLF